MTGEVRVVVAGAGPVGCAFALFATEHALRTHEVVLIDAKMPSHAPDPRMIAVSYGSRVLLERIGAWPQAEATSIHTIHVSERGAFGRALISRDDYGVPALGYVVRYAALAATLESALAQRGISVERGQRVVSCARAAGSSALDIALDSDAVIAADYLVHAEGGVFGSQQQRAVRRDYTQTAVTSFVTVAHPRAHIAWERFTAHGPIALLPASNGHHEGLALVWCCAPEDATRRMALSDQDFLIELHQAFGDRLGAFTSVGQRFCFALGLNASVINANGREFAIGNAAQTLHPVAGQGVNLGLRDAFTLAQSMAHHFDAPAELARAFTGARRVDRAATINLTDWMPRIFAAQQPAAAMLRSVALTMLDVVPSARGVLARQMMHGKR